MSVRISGGKMKGRKISVRAAGGGLRPTSAKVREALFNIIGAKIMGSSFVDLYAGSGAIGMEAMSREAAEVYFVESDRRRAASIEETLSGCGCRPKAVIANMKAASFVERAAREGRKFDIVFLDPPYASEEMEPLLEALGKGEVLAEGAVVVAEHEKRTGLPEEAGVLRKKKTYRYGDTTLTLMEKA
ncbi:MAG: 16S rRNA (guanine(966)-N(2))-methyltransferase RsmD [Nitrospirota bacterium]|jgi:16S rRNA (guanine966-N2)-methyltransferase